MVDRITPPAHRAAAPAAPVGVAASALLLDEPGLARRARTTLAAADVVTVLGSTVGGSTSQVLRTIDHDGEPELLELPAGLAAGVGRGRRVTVVVAPRLADGVWLVLDGTLRRRDERTVVAVDAVWVGCPHGHGHARPVDLAAYATAVPDQLRACMPRFVEHANAEHGPELRELAARRLGVPATEVVAADLAELAVDGVTLDSIALDGGHRMRLRFARAATTAADLGGLLRRALVD